MFRAVLYVRKAAPTKPHEFHTFSTGPFETWEEANATLMSWYTAKSKDGKFEITGGSIEQKVDGIGWVVCDEEPDESEISSDCQTPEEEEL